MKEFNLKFILYIVFRVYNFGIYFNDIYYNFV